MKLIAEIDEHYKGQKTFKPEDFLAGSLLARKLEPKALEWLDRKKLESENGELSPGTYRQYKGYVRNYWIPNLGEKDVREIRFPDLEEFKDNLPRNLKKKTKRNIINGLRTFFSWLRRKGIITELPVFPTVEGDDADVRRAMNYEDQTEALTRIPEHHRDVIEFGMETGLRPGEICALKIKDFDFKAGLALIQRTWSGSDLIETTKGKNKRSIPLSDKAFAIATRLCEKRFADEFLFINPLTKDRYRPRYLQRGIWLKYSSTDFKFYEASRHSFCTQVVESGASALEAQALMRHADLRSTQQYYHATTKKMRNIVNRRGKVIKLMGEEDG